MATIRTKKGFFAKLFENEKAEMIKIVARDLRKKYEPERTYIIEEGMFADYVYKSNGERLKDKDGDEVITNTDYWKELLDYWREKGELLVVTIETRIDEDDEWDYNYGKEYCKVIKIEKIGYE